MPTRVGFQTPFTNLTMDLTRAAQRWPTSSDHRRRRAAWNDTYGEFQAEMDMFNRAFAEVMLEGDAKGRVFTFPIPTYNITARFRLGQPELKSRSGR